MPEYRRFKFMGGTYFFTVVTFNRMPIFATENTRQILHQAWTKTMMRNPFHTDAICLLPDHLHCIWTLPEGDDDYSNRWKEIKWSFTKQYLAQIGSGAPRNNSRIQRGEAAIWQRRFWEHTIRCEKDFNQHVDYIHYNPVKHGLVQNAVDWQWSSLQRYIRLGYHEENWGSDVGEEIKTMGCGE